MRIEGMEIGVFQGKRKGRFADLLPFPAWEEALAKGGQGHGGCQPRGGSSRPEAQRRLSRFGRGRRAVGRGGKPEDKTWCRSGSRGLWPAFQPQCWMPSCLPNLPLHRLVGVLVTHVCVRLLSEV